MTRKMQVNDLLGHCASPDISRRIHLVKARAGKVLPELIRRHGIDLSVMGALCRTGISAFFIGNTADTLLADVHCPFLTVMPQGLVSPVTLEDR